MNANAKAKPAKAKSVKHFKQLKVTRLIAKKLIIDNFDDSKGDLEQFKTYHLFTRKNKTMFQITSNANNHVVKGT